VSACGCPRTAHAPTCLLSTLPTTRDYPNSPTPDEWRERAERAEARYTEKETEVWALVLVKNALEKRAERAEARVAELEAEKAALQERVADLESEQPTDAEAARFEHEQAALRAVAEAAERLTRWWTYGWNTTVAEEREHETRLTAALAAWRAIGST